MTVEELRERVKVKRDRGVVMRDDGRVIGELYGFYCCSQRRGGLWEWRQRPRGRWHGVHRTRAAALDALLRAHLESEGL